MTSYRSLWVQHRAAFCSIEQCVSRLNPNFLTMVTSAGSSVSVWEKWLTQLKLLLLQWWQQPALPPPSLVTLSVRLSPEDWWFVTFTARISGTSSCHGGDYSSWRQLQAYINNPHKSLLCKRRFHTAANFIDTGTEGMTLGFTEQPLMTLNIQLEALRGKTGWVLSALKMLVFCRK